MPDSIHISYTEFKKRRPRWTTSIRRNLEYGIVLLGHFLGRIIPLAKLQTFGKGIGHLAYFLLKKDRGIAEKQLAMVFPEIKDSERSQWAHECFLNFGQMIFEVLAIDQVIKNVDQYIHVDNPEVLEEALAEGKGVILLGIHAGNWEFIMPYWLKTGHPGTVVSTNFADPRLNEFFRKSRERGNIKVLPRGDPKTMKTILKCFQNKESFFLLIDQDTNVPSMFVPFFGTPAKTPIAASSLALKTGAIVVSFTMFRQPNGTFKLKFYRIGSFKKSKTTQKDIFDVTLAFNRHIEELIRSDPVQWAWFHRRWRHQPTEKDLEFLEEMRNS